MFINVEPNFDSQLKLQCDSVKNPQLINTLICLEGHSYTIFWIRIFLWPCKICIWSFVILEKIKLQVRKLKSFKNFI